jgi:hypothetical protein
MEGGDDEGDRSVGVAVAVTVAAVVVIALNLAPALAIPRAGPIPTLPFVGETGEAWPFP